jgi:asparagine synthase (glutamine-hydrolysing)
MCGIFGEIGTSPALVDYGATLQHRGPDDSGWERFRVAGSPACVSLSHRRLAIIDLSPAGHQPMSNEDGSVWIVFNGEVYNFAGLRDDLIAKGHSFRSRTDTETLIHGYEEWGDSVVDRLRGMFAFAIWDSRRRRLFLARDRVGKKPLFYHFSGSRFLFSSEIKAILASGAVSAEPDPVAIHDYLTYLYFPPPRTAFRDIAKLPPATCMSIQVQPDGSLEQRQWSFWDPVEAAGSAGQLSRKQCVERTYALLDEAVRIRMVSDVPLGIFLSGGIDSSAITALASRRGQERVKTFSVSFPDSKAYDELPYADLVAKTFHTEHQVLRPDATCAEYVSAVVRHFDEPFGNPTAILEYILTRLMREHVTVALSGDGGDELFGGYERYRGAALARYYRILPKAVTQRLGPRAARLIRDDTTGRHVFRRLREFGEAAGLDEPEMYINWVGYFSEAEKHDLYTPEAARLVGSHDSADFLRNAFDRAESLDPINRLGYVDLSSFLACNCLEYADRMSMANSVEIRCPFTDHELIEFAFQLPGSLKLRRMKGKWILKEAMRGVLPHEILSKKKVGFNPPVPQWLNERLRPMLTELLNPDAVRTRGLFRPEQVTQLIRDHAENRRDNTFKIWALLVLEIWYRHYIDVRPNVVESAIVA